MPLRIGNISLPFSLGKSYIVTCYNCRQNNVTCYIVVRTLPATSNFWQAVAPGAMPQVPCPVVILGRGPSPGFSTSL